MAEFDRRQYLVRRADISRYKVNQTIPLNVAHGQSYQHSLFAPVGVLCESQVLTVAVPLIAGGGGDHYLQLSNGSSFAMGKSAGNVGVSYGYCAWDASLLQKPVDLTAQCLCMRDVVFDDTNAFVVQYVNNSGVLQAGNMTFVMIARKQVV